MEAKIRTLRSADARAMLDRSRVRNRTLRQKDVTRLQKAIADGQWIQGTGTIIVNRKGDVLDGHHRLTALSKLDGAAIETVVVTVDTDDPLMVLDTGRRRSIPDQFEMVLGLNGAVGRMSRDLWLASEVVSAANYSPMQQFERIAAVYSANIVGINWAFRHCYQADPDEPDPVRVKASFRPGLREVPWFWACMAGIYTRDFALAETILEDLAGDTIRMTPLGSALIRVMQFGVNNPSAVRARGWYINRIVVAFNHYINGDTSIQKITTKGSKRHLLQLDQIVVEDV